MVRMPFPQLIPLSRRARNTLRVAAVAALSTASCIDLTGPEIGKPTVVIAAGDGQFGLPGSMLDEVLQVQVKDVVDGTLLDGKPVQWRIVQGAGAQLTLIDERADLSGYARARLRLGPDTGTVRVEVFVNGNVGAPALFTARAVNTPVISSVQPATVAGGSNLTIGGSNFSTVAADNIVLFGGRRGHVNSATPSSLSVTVPTCVTTRSVELRVQLGAVSSAPTQIQTVASSVSPLSIARGQVRVFTDPAEFNCLFLPTAPGTASYLFVNLNTTGPGLPMPFEFIGLAGGGPPITLPAFDGQRTAATEWERELRLRERDFVLEPGGLIQPDAQARIAALPEIGERSQFNVLNSQRSTDRITAEVRAITEHAIIYLDINTPANGFTQDDLNRLGQLFDDPIYPTDIAVFGQPSDIDNNGKIIILLTPRVNALTAPDDEGFIAGFFFGCDLVLPNRCSSTNRAEIFYALVPDPTGQFGAARSKATIMRTVPAVLAHEFQHMIHFGQKGRLDALWLSEGLAHMAEDLTADALAAQGNTTTAAEFRAANYSRAASFLGETAGTSFLSEQSPGTLEQRGGNWLFVKYLMANYGGPDLLGRLIRSNNLGMANVQAETGRAWNELFTEFAVALWATGASELQGISVDERYGFGTTSLRSIITSAQGYPLRPIALNLTDFTHIGELPPGGLDYLLLSVGPAAQAAFNASFTGRRGGPFQGTGSPAVAVMRVH
jgi:hypothetical protein